MKCNLKLQIERKRQEMIDSALNNGYLSKTTIALSEELDLLMNMYNNCSSICKIDQKNKYAIHQI